MSAEEALWTARTHGSMEVSPSVEAYIGIMTAKRAEKYVVKPASFKLYHMVTVICLFFVTSKQSLHDYLH